MKTIHLKNPCTRLYVEELLERGDHDEAKELQKALQDLGRNLNVDGDIGSITIAAIKQVNNRQLMQTILDNREQVETLDTSMPHSRTLPPWVYYGRPELGVKEIRGKGGSNPRVEQYHDAVGLAWADDDVPWCGSVQGFTMLKAGYPIPKHAASSLAWRDWGVAVPLSKAPLGAMMIKKRYNRAGKVIGGHITMLVGRSKDGTYFYGMGGNQNDAYNIRRYRLNKFVAARMPAGYPRDLWVKAPIMTGSNGRVKES